MNYPAVKLMTLGAVLPNGMVSFSGGSATATAAAGPGTGTPTATGSAVTVQLYNGTGYTSYAVTPGAAMAIPDPTTTVSLSVPLTGISVTMTASLHWNQKAISTSGPTGGLTEKSASLNNWLFAEVHTVIKLLGVTVADLKLHLDYGRVAAAASYQDLS